MSVIKKPSIPAANSVSPDVARVLQPLKENIEIITGTRSGVKPIVQLTSAATTVDIANKANEIVVRLNANDSQTLLTRITSSSGAGITVGSAAGGALTGTYPNPGIANAVIIDANVASANIDGVAATPSLRTLGTGAQQATAGNDSRFNNIPSQPLLWLSM